MQRSGWPPDAVVHIQFDDDVGIVVLHVAVAECVEEGAAEHRITVAGTRFATGLARCAALRD